MTNLSPLSARSFLPTALPTQTDKQTSAAAGTPSADKTSDDQVSLSKNGIDLQQRVEALGNSTVDLAQSLVGSFTQQLFGDAGKGATISFDSVSLDTSSTLAAGIQHSQSANKTSDAAAFSLTDSSHFLGKGTITTADGRKFDFEVEVQYDASLQASASQDTTTQQSAIPDKDGQAPRSPADPLPAVQFPDIHFPGSLQDLFRLFDKPLKTDVVQGNANGQANGQANGNNGQQKLGTLSLRLLNLVNNKALSDTYQPSDRTKAVADAYGAGNASLPSTPAELAAAQAAAANTVANNAAANAASSAATADAAAGAANTAAAGSAAGGVSGASDTSTGAAAEAAITAATDAAASQALQSATAGTNKAAEADATAP